MSLQFHDLRQTADHAAFLKQIGWEILSFSLPKPNHYLFIRTIPCTPISIAKLQRAKIRAGDWPTIFNLCRRHHVVVLYVEPGITNVRTYEDTNLEKRLHKFGFRKTSDSHLPTRTLWINLQQSRGQLLREMKAKTRYNIGWAQRHGISVKILNGRALAHTPSGDALYTLLRHNSRRLRIFGLPASWYQAELMSFSKNCFAALAYHGTRLVAGTLFLTSPTTCFYSHNGSTELGRKLKAPTVCLWEGIVEAKRRGCSLFDFDGLSDESRRLKRWQGFTKFKRSFGGTEVKFVGQFRKFFWP